MATTAIQIRAGEDESMVQRAKVYFLRLTSSRTWQCEMLMAFILYGYAWAMLLQVYTPPEARVIGMTPLLKAVHPEVWVAMAFLSATFQTLGALFMNIKIRFMGLLFSTGFFMFLTALLYQVYGCCTPGTTTYGSLSICGIIALTRMGSSEP